MEPVTMCPSDKNNSPVGNSNSDLNNNSSSSVDYNNNNNNGTDYNNNSNNNSSSKVNDYNNNSTIGEETEEKRSTLKR